MYTIALLVMIPYLQPVHSAFVTPFIGASAHAISGLPRSKIIASRSSETKYKSNAIEHSEQQRKKDHDGHEKSIYPEGTVLHPHGNPNNSPSPSLDRRQLLQFASFLGLSQPIIHPANVRAGERVPIPRGEVFEIEDPNTYSAVVYIPPAKDGEARKEAESLPLLVVLHGAGNNERSALREFARAGSASDSSTPTPGDHANLPPYLLSAGRAPPSLAENFVVVAPYVGKGKRSLYDESRGKILSFVEWFGTWLESQTTTEDEEGGRTTNGIAIDRRRISLFGFSEGSTLAVELATTRRFNGVVVCAYGFAGALPKMAVERLRGIPMWIFHSKGDDVYDVECSNALVDTLIANEGGLDVFGVGNTLKFTKLIPQQGDGVGEKGREHVRAALVASADGEVYSWLLSLK